MFADLLEGLTSLPKKTSPKYFYDAAGSKLFDQITELDAYYPTRTEMGIMQAEIKKMAKAIGPDALLIEFGSGSSLKTRLLLDHLDDLAGYVPIDISESHLLETAAALRLLYPDVEILPVAADYTKPFDIPEPSKAVQKRVVYFPGSTIGNFEPSETQAFLQQAAQVAGPAGSLL
ncbi:MAG: L-histidine N(alpha)-methyltransferase, partial [Bacteroidota bacterium]